jgi:predicted  nucleic acid-binding Zn-ribbon protein
MSETQKTCPSCGGKEFEAWHSVKDKRLVGICVGCGAEAFVIRERQRPGRPKREEPDERPIWEKLGITDRAFRYRVAKARDESKVHPKKRGQGKARG